MILKERFLARIERRLQDYQEDPPLVFWGSLPRQGATPSDLAQLVTGQVERYVQALVPKKYRKAVLDRLCLVESWPLECGFQGVPGLGQESLHILSQYERHSGKLPAWPAKVSFEEAAKLLDASRNDKQAEIIAYLLRKSLFRVDTLQAIPPADDAPNALLTLTEKFPAIPSKVLGITESSEALDGMGIPTEFPIPNDNGEQVVEHASLEKRLGIAKALIYKRATNRWNPAGVGAVALALQEVLADAKRPATALDASQAHEAFISTWGGQTRSPNAKAQKVIDGGGLFLEILATGQKPKAQLQFPMDNLNEGDIEHLKSIRGSRGLRHWAAIQNLLSQKGGRTGEVTWLIDEHIEALGLKSNDADTRKAIAQEVEQLTNLWAVIYNADHSERMRFRIIEPVIHETLQGTDYVLDGMRLQMARQFYSGVRKSNGKLGTAFAQVPTELARLDHRTRAGGFPYAIALGMLFAIRLRWDDQQPLRLKGATLLRMGGMKLNKVTPGRSWQTLRHNLDELVRIGSIGAYRWEGTPGLYTICEIPPAQWVKDRALHGIRPPRELPAADLLDGRSLSAWRANKGHSQSTAAKLLGVGKSTILRAEKVADKLLSPKLRKAFLEARKPT